MLFNLPHPVQHINRLQGTSLSVIGFWSNSPRVRVSRCTIVLRNYAVPHTPSKALYPLCVSPIVSLMALSGINVCPDGFGHNLPVMCEGQHGKSMAAPGETL